MKKANKNGKRLFIAAVEAVRQLDKTEFVSTEETYELIAALEAYSGVRGWHEIVAMALDLKQNKK
jgi:hypothetical protein